MEEGFAMTMKTISPKDLYRHVRLGHNVVLLDIRTQDEYDEGHIPGASLCPLESFDAANIIHQISISYPTPPTIYVTGASGPEAQSACQQLADAGYEYIVKLEGGMYTWITSGFPVKKTKEYPLPLQSLQVDQQMQLIVGAIVTIGTLLGTFINTGFLAIPLLAGVGFTYEGLFGTDYLKQTLLKQSWNK